MLVEQKKPEYRFRMPRKLHAIGLVGVALMFSLGGCGNISIEPSAVYVQPTGTVTNVESTPDEMDGGAGDPPDDDEIIEITIPVEPEPTVTAIAVATSTIEPEATLIPSGVDITSLQEAGKTSKQINNIVQEMIDADVFLIGDESSFIVLDEKTIQLGQGDYGNARYGEGDIVYLNEDGTYIIYSRIAYGEDGPIELDDTYSFAMIDGVASWSSDSSEEIYIFVAWYEGGEFITPDFMTQQVELMQQEEDLADAQAFAEENNLSPVDNLVYNDETLGGQTVGYDSAGNPVVQRENEESQWVEVEVTSESSTYFGKYESSLRGSQVDVVLVYDYPNGWSINTSYEHMLDGGQRPLTPDEYLDLLESEGVVSAPQSLLVLENDEKPHPSVDAITPVAVLGYEVYDLAHRPEITNHDITGQFFMRLSDGRLVMVIADVTLFQESTGTPLLPSQAYYFSGRINTDTGLPGVLSYTYGNAPGVPGLSRDGSRLDVDQIFQEYGTEQKRLLYFLGSTDRSSSGDSSITRAFIEEPVNGFPESAFDTVESNPKWMSPITVFGSLGVTSAPPLAED